jgi:hypothetical protein
MLGGGNASGGGGKGAIPMLFLSLAAAAAAAEAYFSGSPAARTGKEAGFIFEEPLEIFEIGVCNVASAGKGLFNCVDGRRAAALGASETPVDFVFPPGILLDRISVSGASSCID